MRPQEDIDAAANDDRMLEKIAQTGAVGQEFVAAIRSARRSCEQAGLDADFDEDGQPIFTAIQTAKTARYAREDASAILILQFSVMRRLDRNRNFMWAIIAILAYIAFRLK